jgi:exodeoxyribonuclease V alpha subunit
VKEVLTEQDTFDARRARHAPGLLRDFNDAGVLSGADVQVALRLAELGRDDDSAVALAAALAVRGPRLGHVYVDLATIRDTASVDTDEPVDLSALPWPAISDWIERLSKSPLVAAGESDDASSRPLRLVDDWLYLDRYWREERQLATNLRTRGDATPEDVATDVLADGLARLFPGDEDSLQRLAVGAAVLRRLAVVAGGPGTGKTTTVARIVALLAEQADAGGAAAPLVALAAPTGKAAARLEEAVHEEAAGLAVNDSVRAQLSALDATTLHRLLGWRPDSRSRFRHNRLNRLPHDVIVVDETSMVSLSLMSRLVEAVRPEARLVLVGDPGQLTSIEAGAVLGDIVGPASDGLLMRPEARDRLAAATRQDVPSADPPPGISVGDGIVVLDRVHRFGGGIAAVAGAARRGDADALLDVLAGAPDDVTWIPVDVAEPTAHAELAPVRNAAVTSARAVIEAAVKGDAARAIAALGAFRVLCAHRRGEHGVATWMTRIEGWLREQVDGFAAGGTWYVGRPLLVTENDYGLRLYNGDTGVVVAAGPNRVRAAFERRGEVVVFSPARLAAVDTVYAMTIHKSQGSQFDTGAVLLPGPTSQILTRELLYTAVTRARKHLILAGTEEAIRAAVSRPVARASGLRRRLWAGETIDTGPPAG